MAKVKFNYYSSVANFNTAKPKLDNGTICFVKGATDDENVIYLNGVPYSRGKSAIVDIVKPLLTDLTAQVNDLEEKSLLSLVEVVPSLPTSAAARMNTIYLVPDSGGAGENVYIEYILVEKTPGDKATRQFEVLGKHQVKTDLTAYAKKSDLDTLATKAEVGKKADVSALNSLTTEVGKKANKTDLDTLATKTELSTKADASALNSLTTEVGKKANKTDLDTLATKTELSTKADASALSSLTTEVGKKANKTDLDTLATKTELFTKADASALSSLTTEVGKKANKTDLDTLATKTELSTKADASNVYTKTDVDQKIAGAALEWGGNGFV